MAENRVKSINALMKYLRSNKNMDISGSVQKKKLRYMGYYHGYKGYRYYNSSNSLLAFTTFNELQAVYDFDMKVKSIIYPQIMFLETTLKNYALEVIVDESKSKRFADIYSKILNDYKSHSVGSDEYKKAISKRMLLRNKIYGNISKSYGKNNIVSHYYDKDQPLPIWAIFELLSLGEFGNLICCLNYNARKKYSKAVGIDQRFDPDGKMIEKIVYVLRDLRNAIAHNNTVFDTRFKTGNVNKRISRYITAKTNIGDINFDSIVDYIILISFVLKILKYNKKDIITFIRQFEDACESLRKSVSTNISSAILYTNTRRKINDLKNFL